jgi:glycosidase
MEFHVSRQARDHYQFDQALFGLTGNVLFANFHAARVFAQKINQQRDLVTYPEKAVKAGQINALGLIDEILHYVALTYHREVNPQAMTGALAILEKNLGKSELDRTLAQFAAEFPPLSVYRGQTTVDAYMESSTEGTPNREVLLEEMIMLWVANRNPATQPFLELFDDSRLAAETAYTRAMASLREFFTTQPPFGPDRLDLISMMRSPAISSPYSLTSQLEFIRERWADLLGRYLYRLLSSLDLVKEEELKSAMFGFGAGPGPTVVPVYDAATQAELEYEAFSPDRDWMPRLVLIAKNTYVWLNQLSRKYQRPITRLDQIPESELADMAALGFSGLWLIGLWERSRASAVVKQLCGNPDAIASAYSLFDYRIADDLGGEDAYRVLRDNAWKVGIRLASDMVPNHMGIDSPWLVNHPDWFVNLDYSPYPAYSFNGPDLSANPAVSINIEDHYFDRTDASVVFKFYDHRDGRARFVYHGNDGTTMPWNDTAQLNYLNGEVREAVIQTILAVARRFPIIRFDAAMTLAKRHYQRLWFPEPGGGGAIPSRAEHGLTKEQFNAVFPIEFWREVVDRVAQEAPDTLLLAEAFWLMEGYFVRTLGMHRVYNSAFMNMMRNEENSKYRSLIKNTLEFEPDILKRYVNFMNNPDERTAVEQFGKGDKYFGICTLMATLPGLPMFGHGQLEGYSEKYGMEFRKPLWDEYPDQYLMDRHRSEITPLLHHRYLFGGIDHFLLYDFFASSGAVDENVLAYSNGIGSERALVVVHNYFGSTDGWIRMSASFLVKGSGGDRPLVQRSLAEGLGINGEEGWYTIARDQITNQEFLFSNHDLAQNGMRLSLKAYEYHTFLDFHQVQDDQYGSYRQLYAYLNGRGVPRVEEALRELVVQPVLNPFREIANPGFFHYLLDNRLQKPGQVIPPALLDEAGGKYARLLEGAATMSGVSAEKAGLVAELLGSLEAVLSLPQLSKKYPMPGSRTYQAGLKYLNIGLQKGPEARWYSLFGWLFVRSLGKMASSDRYADVSRSWLDEWHLGRGLEDCYAASGLSPELSSRSADLVRLLTEQQNWFAIGSKLPLRQLLSAWFSEEAVQRFLGVNRYKDVLWFNKEAYETFVWWMTLLAVLEALSVPNAGASLLAERVLLSGEIAQKLLKLGATSGYQVAKLLAI